MTSPGTARELGRLGLLYLADGMWNGERILPAGWAGYVATPAPAQPTSPGAVGQTGSRDPGSGGAATADDRRVSAEMVIYWTNFAKTGDPGTADQVRWPRYEAMADTTLVFTTTGPKPVAQFRKDRLDLVEQAAANLKARPARRSRRRVGRPAHRRSRIGVGVRRR